MKYPKLYDLLKAQKKKPTDIIKWEYYGYGIFDKSGECQVKDIPRPVLCSRCFEHMDGKYRVDGAL